MTWLPAVFENHSIIGWSLLQRDEKLVLSKLELRGGVPTLRFSITVEADLNYKAYVYGVEVPHPHSPVLCQSALTSADIAYSLVDWLSRSKICKGNPDEKFVVLQASRKGHFMNSAGMLPVC